MDAFKQLKQASLLVKYPLRGTEGLLTSLESDNLVARHEYILHRLQETGSVAIDGLCATLSVSITTIRRDLEDLETLSLLRRTVGAPYP
jgi:hypothetical protein